MRVLSVICQCNAFITRHSCTGRYLLKARTSLNDLEPPKYGF